MPTSVHIPEPLRSALSLVPDEIARAPWTDEVSACFGEIKADLERKGARIEDVDVAVAAHAIAAKGVLVSANHTHMERVAGLRLEDWSAPLEE